MEFSQYKQEHHVQLCVVGGGLSGLFAAVSAARRGAKVLLMHDRPVLGGNASSEIRMWVRGAAGKENRESGLIQEAELENIYRNPTMNYSVWDTVLYQLAMQEENLTLLLNTSCLGCEMAQGRIAAVTGWQLNSYTFHRVTADLFIDCSGDSILAPLSGAAYRVGREDRQEFDEYGACETADSRTMGSSCLIEARRTDHPCPFKAPDWAYVYPDDESMYLKKHDVAGSGINFWWIELGGEQDTIRDAQAINEDLIKVAYGVWDHLKNHGDHGMDNWELEWIGFLPGKRESRRYEGEYILSQRDLEEGRAFPDTVAFGGWTMDNHSPLGLRYMGYSSHHIPPHVPYEIPFRCLYSKNVPNLLFAGRNISATHMAMSSTRVMATCSVIGQAAGTGAALALRHGCLPAEVTRLHMPELQAWLLEDGCFLPGLTRPATGKARCQISGEAQAVLDNGWERPHGGAPNTVSIPDGQTLSVALTEPCGSLRLALDPDFSRESISADVRYQKFAMRTHVDLPEAKVKMPAHLLRSCTVSVCCKGGAQTRYTVEENRRALVFLPLPPDAETVTLSALTSWGGECVNFFSVDAAR